MTFLLVALFESYILSLINLIWFYFTAFLASTNPFYSQSPQWIEFDHGISNIPSSIFWAFDTAPPSGVVQPSELDIPVKSKRIKGNLVVDKPQNNMTSLHLCNPASNPQNSINTLKQSHSPSVRLPCLLMDSPLGIFQTKQRGKLLSGYLWNSIS